MFRLSCGCSALTSSSESFVSRTLHAPDSMPSPPWFRSTQFHCTPRITMKNMGPVRGMWNDHSLDRCGPRQNYWFFGTVIGNGFRLMVRHDADAILKLGPCETVRVPYGRRTLPSQYHRNLAIDPQDIRSTRIAGEYPPADHVSI